MRRLKLLLIIFFMMQMAWSIFLWNRLNQPATGFEIWGSLLVAGILGLLAIVSVYFRIIMIIANIAYFTLNIVIRHSMEGYKFYLALMGHINLRPSYLDIEIILLLILFYSTFAINATVGILLQTKAKI